MGNRFFSLASGLTSGFALLFALSIAHAQDGDTPKEGEKKPEEGASEITEANPEDASKPGPADALPSYSLPDKKKKILSLELAGFFDYWTDRYHFRVLYKAPNRFALGFWGKPDGIPIAGYADHRFFAYDAENTRIVACEAVGQKIKLQADGDKLVLSHEFKGALFTDRYKLDLKSFGLNCGDSLKREGTMLLGKTEDEDGMSATFDADGLVRNLQVLVEGGTSPRFRLHTVRVNGDIDDKLLRFPSFKSVKEHGKVLKMPTRVASQYFKRALDARTGLNYPKVRDRMGARPPNWEKVAESDKTMGAALKKLLPPPVVPADSK